MPKIFKKIIYFIFSLFFLAFSSIAQADTAYDAHTEVELVSQAQSVRPGDEVLVAVRFKMDPKWHIYWKNPGDSGIAPEIRWELPEGVEAGNIHWPHPKLISQKPLASYGYEGEVFLVVPLKVAQTVPEGDLVLKAQLRWLACEVQCIPGKADLSLTIQVSESVSTADVQWIKVFSETKAQWPIVSEDWQVETILSGQNLLVDFSPKAGKAASRILSAHFFPEDPTLIRHEADQIFRQNKDGYELQIPLSINRSLSVSQITGVLVSEDGWRGLGSEKALAVNEVLSVNTEAKSVSSASQGLGILAAVFFAFLGGVILNLMPCVLPVLSLKILYFVREASENPKKLFAHGLAFAAGVLVSFWILAGLLALIKAAGGQVGWGFQLQSPIFVIILAFVFMLFALNLFGVFEMGTSLGGAGQSLSRIEGFVGSFFSGVFATVVATPCTAPFMGAALGFTLTQPMWVSFIIFTFLGVGMAAPYLILCAQPALLKYIPKPGPWMITLKQLLSFPLLATVVWLGLVLGTQRGSTALIGLFAGLAVAALGAWMWGKRWPRIVVFGALAAGLVIAIGATLSVNTSLSSDKITLKTSHGIQWEVYSDKRLTELRAQGKPVFIDFTAAWCLTCQVNERVALEIPSAVEAFSSLGVVALKADWTSQDAEISAALGRYGRNSVPLYVIYPAGEGDFMLLPEILTPKIVLEALENSKKENV